MVTAGDIIGGGFRLVRERIGSLAIWALLYLAMTVAVQFAMRPFMGAVFAAQAGRAGGTPPDPSVLFQGIGTVFGVYVLFFIGLIVIYTAALRAATRPEEDAFAYLRLGMDELRMLGVGVILFIAFMILYFGMSLVVGLLAGILAVAARGSVAVPIISVILSVFVMFAVLIFFQVRFSLVFALTMLRGRIVIGESWQITRGRFWTLFGAYLVLFLIIAVTMTVLFMVTMGPYFADLSRAGLSPGGMQALQQRQLERQFGPVGVMTLVGWVLGALIGVFWIALGAGAAGTAAIDLLDEDFSDIGAVYE